jgi:hypothetical protein
MASIPNDLIAEARRRWTKCADAEDGQRRRILAAKEFRAGNQWPDAIKRAREGSQALAGVPAQPPRPCLVVDRLSQPVRQTSNTIKNADFGFEVLPNGFGANDEVAEIYKGYMRRVQNNARGESPVEWAADGAIEGGLGWFRLRTEFVHETWDGDPNDPEVFDQEIREERITNNLSVYCDPSATRPTRSDAQFLFVVEDLDKDEFTRRWPKADVRGLEEFMTTGDMVGWVTTDSIRIAEYWRLEYDERTFCELLDGTVVEKTDGSPTYRKDQIRRERVMRVPRVLCDKINAIESLEQYTWVGSRIPLIPVLGEELNVDGRPVLRGIIDEGMDAQRMINYTYSGAMEIFALSSKKAPMIPAASVAAYQPIWQTRTLYNHSYLPYDAWDDQGRQLPQPVMDTTEAPIQAAVDLMRMSEEAVKATTSTGDASLGNSHPNERSGRALEALKMQSELANSNYPDNVRRARIYAAELMLEVIPKITRPGQILQILGMDDEPKQVMIGQPFTEGPNGVPQRAPDGVTPEMAKLKDSLYKFYDLNGKYAVTVTVGKGSATKREEGAMALGQLIPHLPPAMAAVATPDYVRQLSFPGAQKIAERLEKTLPPELQDQDQQAQIPPQAQQLIAQLQQQLQQASQIIQTEQVKQQAQVQSAQIAAQSKQQDTQADLQVKLQIAEMEGRIELQKAAMDNENKLRIEELKLRGMAMAAEIDSREAELARASGVQAQQTEQAGAASEAEAGRAHEREMAERAAAQAAENPNGGGA